MPHRQDGLQLLTFENAMAESFFATLECELLERRSFTSKAEARLALFTFIEGWYNPRRRHSALGYLSPTNYERKYRESNLEHGFRTAGPGVMGAGPAVQNPASEQLIAPSVA